MARRMRRSISSDRENNILIVVFDWGAYPVSVANGREHLTCQTKAWLGARQSGETAKPVTTCEIAL